MKIIVYKIWITEGPTVTIQGKFYPIIEICIPDLGIAINETSFFSYQPKRYEKQEPDSKIFGRCPDPEMIGCRELPESLIDSIVILKQSLSVDKENLLRQLTKPFAKQIDKDTDISKLSDNNSQHKPE